MKQIVNIITPVYNAEHSIEKVYISLKNQSCKNWRWILVDDSSVDQSYEIMKRLEFLDDRIFLVKNFGNKGAGGARKCGLSFVSSPVISFIDADDEWDTNFLEVMMPFVEKPYSLAFSGYRREKTGKSQTFLPKKKLRQCDLFRGSDISCLTAVYNFNTIDEIPLFGEIPARNDLVFNLRALEKITFAEPVLQVLATYKLGSGTISSNKFRLVYWQFKVSRMFGRSRVISVFDVLHWVFYGLRKYYL